MMVFTRQRVCFRKFVVSERVIYKVALCGPKAVRGIN